MNLPAGNVIKTDVDVATVDFLALLKELGLKLFNGYLAIAIKGNGGIEEGTLLFDNGKIVAATYEYFKHGKTMLADKAFVRVLNASFAKHGSVDLVQLSNEQVQLVLAFNENAITIPNEKDWNAFKGKSFSSTYEDEITGVAIPAHGADVMQKYKLTDVDESIGPKAKNKTLKDEKDELSALLE